MKILFIFTGGTISTTLSSSVMSVDNAKPYKLIQEYKNHFGADFVYDCISPYLELSENNTGESLQKLCSSVVDNVGKDYDGIIVTHGTDTLQYSACALAYCVGNGSIPVCLVSSSYPLEHANTNALENLHGAVSIIKNKLGYGVFVPFRNSKDSFVKVHRATRLLPSVPFTDEVLSATDCEYGRFDASFNFVKNANYRENEDGISPFTPLFTERSPVMLLHAHVGMNFPVLSQKVKYVLISSYHSGTVDTKSQTAKDFYTQAKNMGIRVFVSGVYGRDIYESAKAFSEFGITPLPLSPICAYVKLWLTASSNTNESVILQPLGGDL